jgi:hypothetical protein
VAVVLSKEELQPKNHHSTTMLTEDICAMAKHTVNEQRQAKVCRKLKELLNIQRAIT